MKISVIVPVYNTEKYLVECVESVLHQTFMDWELILVDDGSTDSSKYICEKYSNIIPDKIISISKQNEGPYLSRICGIKHSTGEVLMYLDSDDYLRQDALFLINEKFENSKCDILMFNACVDYQGQRKSLNENMQEELLFDSSGKRDLYELIIKSSDFNSMCTKAFRRELCMNSDDFDMPAGIKHGEDLLQLMPIMTKAKRIIYVNQELYCYRKRQESLVHEFDLNKVNSIKYVNSELEKYIEQWGMSHLYKWFYARLVKGWINNLLILQENRKRFTKDEYKKELDKLSNDNYFLKAYESMDKKLLSVKYYYFAKWLYFKRYCLINLAGLVRRLK